MKYLPIVATLFFVFSGYAQKSYSQKTNWAISCTSQNPIDIYDGTDIKTDKFGRIYTVGMMLGDSMMIGSTKLKNTGANVANSYIARLDSTGKVIWIQTMKGGGTERIINHLGIDDDGSIYIAGKSIISLTIGKFSLTEDGLFLAKFDSNGTVIWLKKTGFLVSSGIKLPDYHGFYLDKKGNSYFTALWKVGDLQVGNIKISSLSSDYTSFIAKFDSSGNVLWAKPFGAAGNADIQNLSIGIDTWENVYVCEAIDDYVTIGKNTYSKKNNYYYASYLAKFSNKGDLAWSKLLNISSSYGSNIAVDPSGFIYFTSGSYSAQGSVFDGDTLDRQVDPNNSANGNQSVTVKFDSSGKTVWAKQITPIYDGTNLSLPIFLDRNGDIYIAGTFNKKNSFGKTVYNFSTNSGGECYIAKYNNDGVEQNFMPIGFLNPYVGGAACPHINAISVDPSGNIYLTGGFRKKVFFDSFSLNSLSGTSSMVVKVSPFPILFPDSLGYAYACGAGYTFKVFYNSEPDSVSWFFGDHTKSKQMNPVHIYTKTGTYTVQETTFINGKASTLQKTVIISQLSGINLGKDTSIAPGKPIILRSGFPDTKWSTGAIGDSIVITSAGTYWATSNANGCTATDTIVIKSKSGINSDDLADYHLQLIPNPASENTLIKFNAPGNAVYFISVTDITGKEVFRKMIAAKPGENTLDLNVASFKRGDYIINLDSNGAMQHIKFIKE